MSRNPKMLVRLVVSGELRWGMLSARWTVWHALTFQVDKMKIRLAHALPAFDQISKMTQSGKFQVYSTTRLIIAIDHVYNVIMIHLNQATMKAYTQHTNQTSFDCSR